MFKGLFQKKVVSANNNVNLDSEMLQDIDMQNLPQHIAIIMDGNGRWAKAQGKPRTYGHQVGAETLKTIVKAADKLGIKAITAYTFSTENWKRPITEVDFIMELVRRYLDNEMEEFKANNVRICFIGSREGIPKAVQASMDKALEDTKNNTGIVLNLAINYGGQAEILHAVKNIAAKVSSGELAIVDIDERVMEDHLYTKGLPMPDLLIRPGGDLRISNFLLWQIAYAEIWTTPVYWPDFTPEHLIDAICAYQGRERRFGGLITK